MFLSLSTIIGGLCAMAVGALQMVDAARQSEGKRPIGIEFGKKKEEPKK